MARKKKRSSYGAGCIVQAGKGLAIRWRETVVDSNGNDQRVLRYKARGDVSVRDANSVN